MKYIVSLLALLCFACGGDKPEKPEKLLSEDEMVNILYDLSILQTMSSTTPWPIQENNVDVNNYIYRKYNIDSLTFAKNQRYYAADIEKYQTLNTRVLDRLKLAKAPLDSLEKPKVKPGTKKLKKNAASGVMPVSE